MNTRVLAFLSAVAGDALTRHLGVILPALLSSLKEKLGTEEEAQVTDICNCFSIQGIYLIEFAAKMSL